MSDSVLEHKNPIEMAVDLLLDLGRKRSYVTWEEMNAILPDEAVDPHQLELILLKLEEFKIEMLDEIDAGRAELKKKGAPPTVKRGISPVFVAPVIEPTVFPVLPDSEEIDTDIDVPEIVEEVGAKRIDDPVRMYLTQMGEIPLLTRAEEIRLAKKIELTRMAFRQKVLESDYCAGLAVDILQQVHDGTLPFDRTMKISTSEHAAKSRISSRM